MSPIQDIHMAKIEALIKQYHELFTIPLKAEYWEDLFNKSINDDKDHTDGFSHSAGADVVQEEDDVEYQCKSGTIIKTKNKHVLQWSGNRTTTQKTLKDKIAHISNMKYDYFVFLARNDKEDWDNGIKKYYLIKLNARLIKYDRLDWGDKLGQRGTNTGEVVGYEAANKWLRASITFSMSDQLWTEVDYDFIERNADIREITI